MKKEQNNLTELISLLNAVAAVPGPEAREEIIKYFTNRDLLDFEFDEKLLDLFSEAFLYSKRQNNSASMRRSADTFYDAIDSIESLRIMKLIRRPMV